MTSQSPDVGSIHNKKKQEFTITQITLFFVKLIIEIKEIDFP